MPPTETPQAQDFPHFHFLTPRRGLGGGPSRGGAGLSCVHHPCTTTPLTRHPARTFKHGADSRGGLAHAQVRRGGRPKVVQAAGARNLMGGGEGGGSRLQCYVQQLVWLITLRRRCHARGRFPGGTRHSSSLQPEHSSRRCVCPALPAPSSQVVKSPVFGVVYRLVGPSTRPPPIRESREGDILTI
jgi:hypothetical protein